MAHPVPSAGGRYYADKPGARPVRDDKASTTPVAEVPQATTPPAAHKGGEAKSTPAKN